MAFSNVGLLIPGGTWSFTCFYVIDAVGKENRRKVAVGVASAMERVETVASEVF
jgi:hypothetical protein